MPKLGVLIPVAGTAPAWRVDLPAKMNDVFLRLALGGQVVSVPGKLSRLNGGLRLASDVRLYVLKNASGEPTNMRASSMSVLAGACSVVQGPVLVVGHLDAGLCDRDIHDLLTMRS